MIKIKNCLCIFISLTILFICGSHLEATPVINSVSENKDPVAKYEKFELSVDFGASYSNPYNPDEVNLAAVFTSPSNVVWGVNGFYDGTSWLVRFAANETGQWSYVVKVTDSTGTKTSNTYTFTCDTSSYHGWLKVSSVNTHYLMYDDSATFYGIGHCRAWNPETTSLSTLASYGGNFLVYWNGPPWDRMIESMTSGIGKYDQNECDFIDGLLERCEQNGVYLCLVIWPHPALRDNIPWSDGKWTSNNPYSTITTAANFFTDTTSWQYQQKLYRYIIARWGYSRALGVWNFISEIDGTAGYYYNKTGAETWCSNIQTYFDTNDPYGHLTSGSKSGDVYWSKGYGIFDLAEMHSYNDSKNAVTVASTIATQTRRMWNDFTKPAFHGEFGTDDSNLQPKHLHNGIWAGLASGAAITPLDWNDGGDWGDMTSDMLNHMKYFADFVEGIDFANLAFVPATVSVSGCNAWGMRTSDFAFGWIQNTSGNVDGKDFTISGLNDRTYQVQWYDTWTGTIVGINNDVNCSGGSLTNTIPSVSRVDIACKIIGSSPPNTPDAPLGNETGTSGIAYTYSISTTDQDGDKIKFIFDWGDGTKTTTDLNNSGTTVSASHFWSNGGTYTVKVRAVDAKGAISDWGQTKTVKITGPLAAISGELLKVLQNYPNPFYVSEDNITAIRYSTSRKAKVTIKIYDLRMRLVKTLLSGGWKETGLHEDDKWSGDNEDGEKVGSGIYFYRIEAEFDTGNQEKGIRKMMVVK